MVLVGNRNVRGTLESPTEAQDAHGQPVPTWSALTIAPVDWAEVRPTTGREFFLGQQTFGELTAVLRFRHRTDLDERMRFVTDAGDVWMFVSPPSDPDGKRREIVVVAVKRA